MSKINLVKFVPNFPYTPSVEIPRDAIVRQIERNFGPDCQEQLIVGGPQTGKSNLLSQFARQHNERTVSYFITSNPVTHTQYSYLYTMCLQLSAILGETPPTTDVRLDSLRSLFVAQCISLAGWAKERNTRCFYIVDGIEGAFDGEEGNRIIDFFPPPNRSAQSIFVVQLPFRRCRHVA